MRTLSLSLALPWWIALPLSATCPCMLHFGVCDEVGQSDTVFIGTAESVAPPFLDPFARAQLMASMPASEIARLQADSSPAALEKLKSVYLRMFAGVPDYSRARIAEAATQPELQAAFEDVQSEGRVARFRVQTFYKRDHGDDDDSKKANPAFNAATDAGKADDKPAEPEFIEIWTGSGECGVDFQAGETYLVYAAEDEGSGRLETSVCMRTRRLSEEKGDLAYLYFLQNNEKESTRLEGFVSTSFADQNLPRYEDDVSAPLPGATVELDTGAVVRYAQTDEQGRFFFDGLKPGDYRISLLAPGFPRTARTVVLSRGFHSDETGCPRQILIVPSRP